jgi:hypothetical protein
MTQKSINRAILAILFVGTAYVSFQIYQLEQKMNELDKSCPAKTENCETGK